MKQSIRFLSFAIWACVPIAASAASHQHSLADVSVEGIRSLPAGLDAQARDVLAMVLEPGGDIAQVQAKLRDLEAGAQLYSVEHRLPDGLLHERVDLAALKARIESPGTTAKDRLMIAVAMEAFMVALNPVLAMPENRGLRDKFQDASATAARFLPEDMRKSWEAADKGAMVKNFMTAGAAEDDRPADVLAFAPFAAAVPASAKLKPAGGGVELSSIAGLEPIAKLQEAHPDAARELGRLASAVKISPQHYVWLDQPGDEARSGLFAPDVVVILGPGFHNTLAFHSQGPIFAWNATIEAPLASDRAILIAGKKSVVKADLRGKVVTDQGVNMENATVNGQAARRPLDMDFVNAKIREVAAGHAAQKK